METWLKPTEICQSAGDVHSVVDGDNLPMMEQSLMGCKVMNTWDTSLFLSYKLMVWTFGRVCFKNLLLELAKLSRSFQLYTFL